jgi:prepilin-type N-terminal cleavage/methylation domain-containing protein
MKNQKGFTLPELIITMGILSILFGFVAVNLIHLQRRSSLTTTVDTLVSDLYSQQNKAMVGDTEGRVTADEYGVHFETNKYSFFHGLSYSTSDFDVELDPSLQFLSTTDIIFSKGGGEVSGAPITVTLQDTTNGNIKTIIFNRYGVITDIN